MNSSDSEKSPQPPDGEQGGLVSQPRVELRPRQREGQIAAEGLEQDLSQSKATGRRRLFVPIEAVQEQVQLRRRIALRRRKRKEQRRRLQLAMDHAADLEPSEEEVARAQAEDDLQQQAALEERFFEQELGQELESQQLPLSGVNRTRHRHETQLILFALALMFLGVLQLVWKLLFPLPEQTEDEFAQTALWDTQFFSLPPNVARDADLLSFDEYQGQSFAALESQKPQLKPVTEARLHGTTRSGQRVYRAEWLSKKEGKGAEDAREEGVKELEQEQQLALKVSAMNGDGKARFLLVDLVPKGEN